jgi:nitrogen fixation protein NifB
MTVIPISSAPGFAVQVHESTAQRLRLPVAPVAVCRMRYATEGKIGPALNANEVLAEIGRFSELAEVQLEGPGDPLASLGATLATVALLRQHRPAVRIGLTTAGIGGAEYATELAAAGIDTVTLLIETLDAATAEQLYAWIRPGKKTLPLAQVVPILLDEQAKAIPAMVEASLAVTVRTTVYPGLNAHQIATMAETLAELGSSGMELVPFVPDAQQANAPAAPNRVHMEQIAKLTSRFLPTVSHQVSVEACGCDCGPRCTTGTTCGCGAVATIHPGLPQPSTDRPRVAVASATGMEVDLHLGQAKTLLIYGPREDGLVCLLETRQAPEPGSGESRWDQLADTLQDCFALLAASAGQRPREVLGGRDIRVILTEDNIEGTVDVLYGGGKKQQCKK